MLILVLRKTISFYDSISLKPAVNFLSQHKLNVCVQIRLITSVSHELGH